MSDVNTVNTLSSFVRVRTRLGVVLAGAMLSGVAFASAASAQPAALAPSIDPGRVGERNRLDGAMPLGTAPVVSAPQDVQPQVQASGASFVLKAVQLDNATMYDSEDLQDILASRIGKTTTLGDIQALANAITARYRADGFLLSRVIVPPQEVQGGVVRLQVIEGYVDNVVFVGAEGQNQALLKSYAHYITREKPLRSKTLERQLLLMDDLTGLSARGVLSPSQSAPGASTLQVSLTQKAVEGAVGVDNYGSRYLGHTQYNARVGVNSALGLSEQIQARTITSGDFEELNYYEVSYLQPVGGKGLTVRLLGSYTDTRPGAGLEVFDIEGESKAFELSSRFPVVRSRRENFFVDGGLRYRDTSTDALGFGLYEDNIRSVYAGVAYDKFDALEGINRLNMDLAQGVSIAGANGPTDALSRANADPEFTRIAADYSRLQSLGQNISVYAAVAGQYAFDPLFASEEFAIGRESFGSAYDPAEIAGDSGIAARAELRYSDLVDSTVLNMYQLYTFYDGGKVWNRDVLVGERESMSLTSAGLGTRLDFSHGVSGTAELAFPLTRNVSAEGDDDARGFFSLNYVF